MAIVDRVDNYFYCYIIPLYWIAHHPDCCWCKNTLLLLLLFGRDLLIIRPRRASIQQSFFIFTAIFYPFMFKVLLDLSLSLFLSSYLSKICQLIVCKHEFIFSSSCIHRYIFISCFAITTRASASAASAAAVILQSVWLSTLRTKKDPIIDV